LIVLALSQYKGGVIINITSAAARTPLRNNSVYNASKSAAAMLTRTAAVEVGKHNIRIIEVAPGPIEPPMLRGYLEKEQANNSPVIEKTVEAHTLLGRIGLPEEVAVFLCSPSASFVTAASLSVDAAPHPLARRLRQAGRGVRSTIVALEPFAAKF
jgi:glucose 1-dehydrogenase